MTRQYSIAEARDHFAAIIHELDSTSSVQVTRRGKPVAMLLSLAEYERLAAVKSGFWSRFESFRSRVNVAELDIGADVFGDLRDESSGREIDL